MPSSRSWAGSTGAGASVIGSCACWFLGKAITSRMLSVPSPSMTMRSMPPAQPPCGGTPYSKASSRKPNLRCASSASMPSAASTRCWIAGVGDADAAAADLAAVDDEVVGARSHRERVGLEEVEIVGVDHRERVMRGADLAGLVAALEHRELGDPEHVDARVVVQAARPTEVVAQRAERGVHHARTVGDHEDAVADLGTGGGADRVELLGGVKNFAMPPCQPSARFQR